MKDNKQTQKLLEFSVGVYYNGETRKKLCFKTGGDMSFFSRVSQVYDTLTPKEKVLADYITAHPNDVMHMNIRELGLAANVSPSTVVRFARSMGYDKYGQMLISIARDQQSGSQSLDLTAGHLPIDVLARHLCATIQKAVVETLSMLQASTALQTAAEWLIDAKTIYLYGVGASGVEASGFLHKMIAIDKPCKYYSDPYLSRLSSTHISSSDVAIGISYSGRNQAVLTAIEEAKKKSAKTIGVTRVNSQLARSVDLRLYLPIVDDDICKGVQVSRYAQSMVLDTLFLAMTRQRR